MAGMPIFFPPMSVEPKSEPRSTAVRLERRGPTGEEHPQESNRAHLRAAIAALQCRDWRGEGWRTVTIASDSEYLVEGITNWVEIWQETGWLHASGAGSFRQVDLVANKDLWQHLIWELTELARRGLVVNFWLILHGLNADAHAEARFAAEVLKEEEYFVTMPRSAEMMDG